MRKGVVILGIAFGIGLGVLIGYLLWGWWARPAVLPEKKGYDLFRDLITLILAIGTIVITAAGYFIYTVISEKTKAVAISGAQEEMRFSSAMLLTHIGLAYWYDYLNSEEKKRGFLDQAINLTEEAYTRHAIHLDEHKYERLICSIRNNLAYYYAKRKSSEEDRKRALGYAAYIQKTVTNIPTIK